MIELLKKFVDLLELAGADTVDEMLTEALNNLKKEIERDHIEGEIRDQLKEEYKEFATWDEFGAMREHSRFPEGRHENR